MFSKGIFTFSKFILNASSNDCTAGKLRVWAVVADIADKSAAAASVDRDVLA